MNDSEKSNPLTLIDSKLLAELWEAKIFEDTMQYLPNRTAPYWRFEVPDFAIAIGLRGDGRIPLVRQYRHGAKRFFWEFPAGLMVENELPSDCVKREFSEEVGYELSDPILLSKFYPYAGRSAQVAYVYTGVVGDAVGQKLDAVEQLEVTFVQEASIFKLLSENISASHLLAYLLYRDYR